MTFLTKLGRGVFVAGILVVGASLGCTGGAPSRPGADGGTGGTGTAGKAGKGGSAGTLGGAGEAGNAGSLGSGGELGGGETGGSSANGGSTAAGGGGAPGSGGKTGTGGGTAGAKASGGSSAGGSMGAGGAPLAVNCVKKLFGRYLLRNDGKVLYEADPPSTDQIPVLDAATGLPLPDLTEVFEGFAHGCTVQESSKTAWCWRTVANGNASGQLGNGVVDTSGSIFRATQVLTSAGQPLTNVVSVADGEVPDNNASHNSCAITSEGKVYCWGNLTWVANGGTALTSAFAVAITTDGTTALTGVVQVGLWSNMACAVVQGAAAKEVWCWGANAYGQLGLGDKVTHRYPTKVVGISSPTKVTAHDYYGTACVLDGANVRCWGQNAFGQTGNGMASNSVASVVLAPTLVTLMGGATALGDIVDLHGGDNSNYANFCGLTGAKTITCWGYGFEAYPTDYGVTNVVALGGTGALVRYVTTDGMYHIGAMNNHVGTARAPNCGLLQ